MFEDDDPNEPRTLEDADQQFFAALTLLCLAIIIAGLWGYYVITVGVYGPAQ